MSVEDSQTKQAGSCSSCEQTEHSPKTATDSKTERDKADREAIARRMDKIAHKVLVLWATGGGGKSTVAVNIAATLVSEGKKVGLMDIDMHGPSISKLVTVQTVPMAGPNGGFQPALTSEGLKVMSIGYMLQDREDAVIWRGPMKHGVIRQFLADVEWGELDYLVVDSPPGTGDEPLSIAQSIEGADGAVIVTTPQEVAVDDVRRSIGFCRKVNLPVIGVVENMSGFVCPQCGKTSDIFKRGGGAAMADQMKVRYLGEIPIDPAIVLACDDGIPFVQKYVDSQTTMAFQHVIQPLLQLKQKNTKRRKSVMKIAVPIVEGRLSPHFGHCETFTLIDVDKTGKEILKRDDIEAPPHQPGLLPGWLHERGAQMIFAGGMGSRAQELFAQNGIEVLIGAPSEDPEELVRSWMNGTLTLGDNVCDH